MNLSDIDANLGTSAASPYYPFHKLYQRKRLDDNAIHSDSKRSRKDFSVLESGNVQEIVGNDDFSQKTVFTPDLNDLETLMLKWKLEVQGDKNVCNTKEHEWNICCAALVCYGNQYGNCNVPQNLKCQLPDGKVVNLGVWLSSQRSLKNKSKLREDRFEKLLELVNRGLLHWTILPKDSNKWNSIFNQLLEYGEKHNGDCNVPRSYALTLPDSTEIKLGVWLATQRQQFKLGTLRRDRLCRLQELVDQNKLILNSTESVGTPVDEKWDAMFHRLQEYGKVHNGDCNVPRRFILHECGSNINLGNWLHTQRTKHKAGRLPPDRLDRLQGLVDQGKLRWNVTEMKVGLPDDHQWSVKYDHLVEYGEKHNGDCNVPYSFNITTSDNTVIKLGKWLSNQRTKYKSGFLSQDRLDRLQALVDQKKLLWSSSELVLAASYDDERWSAIFRRLLEYGENHNGDCNVPRSYSLSGPSPEDNINLGNWLSKQRRNYRAGTLPHDRLGRLQALVDQKKLLWNVTEMKGNAPDDHQWSAMFDRLLEYGAKHSDDCNAPYNYVITASDNTDVKLGAWLSTQRQQHHAGILPQDRLDRLQGLVDQGKLRWNVTEMKTISPPDDNRWNFMCKLLSEYKESHGGDSNVPRSYSLTVSNNTEIKLGRWLSTQRSYFRAGKLLKHRVDRLQEILDTKAWNKE